MSATGARRKSGPMKFFSTASPFFCSQIQSAASDWRSGIEGSHSRLEGDAVNSFDHQVKADATTTPFSARDDGRCWRRPWPSICSFSHLRACSQAASAPIYRLRMVKFQSRSSGSATARARWSGNQFLWRLSRNGASVGLMHQQVGPIGRTTSSRRRVRCRSSQGRARCQRGDFRAAELYQGLLRKNWEDRHDRTNGLRARRSGHTHEGV